MRAPRAGWLLVAGRRGHYGYCDELNAYNLSNGDALRARHCSELVLKEGGEVDFQKTERRATEELDVGSLNVENLREAAWMLLMSTETAELRTRAVYVELPRGMDRRLVKGAGSGASYAGGMSWSSAQTQLIWSLVHRDFRVDGEAVWPFSDDPVEEHVARLLEVAEEGWRTACPVAAPPSSVIGRLFPGVNDRDADVDIFSDTFQRLKKALVEWRPESCLPPARE
jgi:hypothetical protein